MKTTTDDDVDDEGPDVEWCRPFFSRIGIIVPRLSLFLFTLCVESDLLER